MKNIKIYSIVYNNEQVTEYQRYDNSHIKTIEQHSYLFEYNVLIDLIDNFNIEDEYLGVFSHKFPYKTGLFKKKLYWLLKNNPGFDVYGLCPQLNLKGKYLSFTEKVHPLFKPCMDIICKEFNLPYKEPEIVIYSNFVVMKTAIYREYIEFLKQVILFMEENNELKNLLWQDFNYESGLSSNDLKNYTGLDFYTGHTFCIERCLNLWLMKKNIKIKQLI